MESVGFTRMEDGTQEDYELLGRLEQPYLDALPDRLLAALDGLKESFAGYQVTRYEHSLQSATRAERDGRDEEYVVACLLHDIGDELAPTHGEMMGAVLGLMWRRASAGSSSTTASSRATTTPTTPAATATRATATATTNGSTTARSSAALRPELLRPRLRDAADRPLQPMVQRVFAEPRHLDEGEA